MKDRFVRGLVAGIIGGAASAIYSYFGGLIGFATLTIAEWIAIFLFAHVPPFSFGELVFSYIAQIGMGGVLGVGFSFWVPHVTSRHLVLKGCIYSVAIWFTLYGITTLFQLMGTVPTPLKTALSNFVSASIYGVSLAIALRSINSQDNTANNRRAMAPAMKPLDNEDDTDTP